MKRKSCLLLASLIVLCWSSIAFAGIYWESEVKSTGMPGQSDGARIEKHYMTDAASRAELGNGTVIITKHAPLTTYHVDPVQKTYMEIKMPSSDMLKKGPPGMSEKMRAAMGAGMQVTPTSEKKVIEGYECTKYDITFMHIKGEYWVSKDVKGYSALKTIGKKLAGEMEKSPAMSQMNMAAVINKVDGFPVQSIMQVGGGRTTSTLKKVEEKDLGEDLFTIPAGYRLVEMGSMGRP